MPRIIVLRNLYLILIQVLHILTLEAPEEPQQQQFCGKVPKHDCKSMH